MEMNVKIAEVKGFTKEEALSTVGFNAGFKNATQAWIKANKPSLGTTNFKVFAAEYLKKQTKGAAGIGAHVVVESGVADSRERPYKVISIATQGARKFKRTYQIVEAELETKMVKSKEVNEEGVEVVKETLTVTKVKSLGAVVAEAGKKGEAEALVKEWIIETKRDYIINIAEKVVEGEPIAAYAVYTPSISAKQGTYIVFGVEVA